MPGPRPTKLEIQTSRNGTFAVLLPHAKQGKVSNDSEKIARKATTVESLERESAKFLTRCNTLFPQLLNNE
jgi:hypothetical protein